MIISGERGILARRVQRLAEHFYGHSISDPNWLRNHCAIAPSFEVAGGQSSVYHQVLCMTTKMRTARILHLGLCLALCDMDSVHGQGAPTITNQPVSSTNLIGSSVVFTVGAEGVGPFSYQWQFNGSDLPQNIISTVAGNGEFGFYGDGGSPLIATLNSPYGLTIESDDSLVIADTGNNRIRKVNTNGIITTVAGNGEAGYLADGGPATNSNLNGPLGVASDIYGNLYIADTANNRIRKVDTNGIITTVAGNGTGTRAGDGGPATNASLNAPYAVTVDPHGNLYIADEGNNCIRIVNSNGTIATIVGTGVAGFTGDGAAATNADLNQPTDVAVDGSGNLFIADRGNSRIRKVDTNGIISTIAGGCGGGSTDAATNVCFADAFGVSVDASGNLFIADANADLVYEVYATGTFIGVAGNGDFGNSGDGGSATSAEFLNPVRTAVDHAGGLYIADDSNSNIRKVQLGETDVLPRNQLTTNESGSFDVIVSNSYGSVTSAVASLLVVQAPNFIVQPASQSVALGSNVTLSVVAAGTPPLYFIWYQDHTNEIQSGQNSTLSLTNMNPADAGDYFVVVTNAYGSATSQVAVLSALTASPPSVVVPSTMEVLPGQNATFLAEVSGSGPLSYQWQFNGVNLSNGIISTLVSGLNGPSAIAFDAQGNLYIAELFGKIVNRLTPSGKFSSVAGNGSEGYSGDGGQATNAGLYYPYGVVVDNSGNLYVGDMNNNRVRRVGTNGIISTAVGNGNGTYSGDGGPSTNASVNQPHSMILDASGNLFIADSGNNRVRKVDTNGIISTVAGCFLLGNPAAPLYGGDGGPALASSLNYPTGIAVDASGRLFIADFGNNRVRMVDTNGIITTIAGNGTAGYAGDNGPGVAATLYGPESVVVDIAGNVLFSDQNNQRVRQVDMNWIISTVAGNGSRSSIGDGGAATNASLYFPAGLTVDPPNNLYIADFQNNRIQKVLRSAGYPSFTLFDVTQTNAGDYTVVVTSAYGSVTSAAITLVVQAPPVIVQEPTNQFSSTDGSATFSVTAGGSGPFGYLWYFSETNLIQSGPENQLVLENLTADDEGIYTVAVTNAYGSVTSKIVTLTLADSAPKILVQPTNETVIAGSNAVLSVLAVGNPAPYYQWRLNGTNLPNVPKLITSVAGTGAIGFSGDGGLAMVATFDHPNAAVFDSLGDVLIADSGNNRVREISTNGIITTIAGNGLFGRSQSGKMATNTPLENPTWAIADSVGNIYISETGANYIAVVATNGLLTNTVGKGIPSYGGDGGAASKAYISSPNGIALGPAGELFIADTGNCRITKVDTNGIISTFAGISGPGYSGDGGPATNAELNVPQGVFVDALGNVLVSDTGNNRVRKIFSNGTIVTIAGNGANRPWGSDGDGGAATNAALSQPTSAVSDLIGNVYIADSYYGAIREVDTNGIITTIAGGGFNYPGDNGPAVNAILYTPSSVCLDSAGDIVIADNYINRIRELPASSPLLFLNSVTGAATGNYTVIVTNVYGSVTSSVANLNVTIPNTQPHLTSAGVGFGSLTNSFGFDVTGAFGQTIVIDGSFDLLNWTPLFTNSLLGNPYQFTDQSWTNSPWRFYRARLQ